jgi:hypothetical protein
VRNNPIKYSDPTGHYVDEGCGSGDLCEFPVKKKEPVDGDSGGEPSSGSACQGTNQSILCLPSSPSPPPIPTTPFNSQSNEAPNLFPSISPDLVQEFGSYFTEWLDIFDYGATHLRMPYKYARSFQFNPLQEALVSGVLQGVADINNDLTIFQRSGRALWAGGEAATIDLVTAPVIAGFTAAGGIAGAGVDGPVLPFGEAGGMVLGYGMSSLTSNHIAISASENWVTPWVYNAFNLYDPNGK